MAILKSCLSNIFWSGFGKADAIARARESTWITNVETRVQAGSKVCPVRHTFAFRDIRIAVKEIAGDGERKATEAFSGLQSHYLFTARFGRPGKGNDKGNVEGLVGYVRRNFLVPVPRAASWEDLNAELLEQCRRRRQQRVRGHQETIAERFERDREKLLPLPPTAYEACQKRTTRASSQALVRYETNDYSVPVEYGHRPVLVKAFVWEMVIACGSEVIAWHARSYGREEMIFNPLHYLALLEQKSNALDQAAPLEGWQLPEEFADCGVRWKRGWASGGGASMCRCCGCWRPFRWRKWPPRAVLCQRQATAPAGDTRRTSRIRRLPGRSFASEPLPVLSAVKSLLAFGHRIGYLRFDVGRALRFPPVRNLAVGTSDGVSVCDHLARSSAFCVLEVEDGRVTLRTVRERGADACGNHRSFMEILEGCHAVICRGIGPGAEQSLVANRIQPVVAAGQHSIEDAMSLYLVGTLPITGERTCLYH